MFKSTLGWGTLKWGLVLRGVGNPLFMTDQPGQADCSLNVQCGLQLSRHYSHERISPLWFKLEALQNDLFEICRNIRVVFARRQEAGSVQLFLQNFSGCLTRKGLLICQQFVCCHPE